MISNLKTLLIFAISFLTLAKSDKVEYLETLEKFQTREILETLSTLNTNSTCADDLVQYLTALKNTDMWALRMFDSSAKIPDGIFTGNSMIMGHYDECIAVENEAKTFTGQHCMFSIDIKLPLGGKYVKMVQPMEVAVTEALGLSLFYGICLPSTCSAAEINLGLKYILNKNNISENFLNISVDGGDCRTKEPVPIEDGDWVVIGVLIAFGVIALLSTLYDVFEKIDKKNEKPHLLLSSFSIYTNGAQLFRISDANKQLQSLNGMRFFSMCWVVLCHGYGTGLSGPVMLSDVNYTFIINGFVSVDSFFFLSGFLVCLVFFRDISRKKYYDVPLSYIHRYLRLTPPFAFMILIQATVFVYFGDGPLWRIFGESSAGPCREVWWSGILYVQNFATPESTCLGQSWYLSVDMQLYWLAPLLLYPMLFWPLFAPIYLVLLILAVAFADFAIAYVYELGPNNVFTLHNMDQAELDYTKFYTRAVPWLVGAGLAYIICGIQAKKIKIKLTPFWIMIGWLLSAGLCLGALYGIVPFTDFDYTTLEAAFYLPFHRLMWALGLAWVVFACSQGYGGIINTFLSWGVFQPLGKLSYCTFLIHMSVQLFRLGTLRTNFFLGNLEMMYYFLGDLVLANLLSIPFTLLFEMPFGNIDRYLFQNVKILPLPRPKKETKEIIKEVNNNDKNDDNLKEVVAVEEKQDRLENVKNES